MDKFRHKQKSGYDLKTKSVKLFSEKHKPAFKSVQTPVPTKEPLHIYNKELVFHAMQRSGHHAIIIWIAFKFEKPVFYLNWVRHYLRPEIALRDRGHHPSGGYDCFRKVSLGNLYEPSECIMYNYEESGISDFRRPKLDYCRTRFNVLIVRDIFNIIASRLKHGKQDVDHSIKLWKTHAREAIGETNYLDSLLYIDYNQWFQSKNYRASITKRLKLPFNDKGLNIVSNFGYGSSFNGRKFNGKAQEMNVLKRWGLLPKEILSRILRDPETIRLSLALHRKITRRVLTR